jgi:hypothetical protein
MAAPGTFTFFAENLNVEKMSDLVSATVKLALVSSAWTPDSDENGNGVWADISANEIAAGNGYTAKGVALGSKAVTAITAGNGYEFESGNASWTASGAGIPAHRYVVMLVDGALWGLTDPLIGYFLADSAPADVPLTASGNTIQYNCPANGWFRKTRT